jgi:hypothetical protein
VAELGKLKAFVGRIQDAINTGFGSFDADEMEISKKAMIIAAWNAASNPYRFQPVSSNAYGELYVDSRRFSGVNAVGDTAAGNAAITIGNHQYAAIYSASYTEAGAATPSITLANTAGYQLIASVTVTASAVTMLTAYSPCWVSPGGDVITPTGGAAGDTWDITYLGYS